MGLSCSCGDWEGEPGSWTYFDPEDFIKFSKARRKRCSSCKKLIGIGDDCLEFLRERAPYTEIEERICGEEIPMSPLFMCEHCGEIYLNLSAVGYCLSPDNSMDEYLMEYHELTGFSQQVGE